MRKICMASLALLALTTHSAWADTGKLLLTGGVSSVDGVAGGGMTPWAVTGTQATQGEKGASAFYTRVSTQDYGLSILGASFAIDDRWEVSLARQDLDTGVTGTLLGLPGLHLKQDIVGVKVRLMGDAILDADTWKPQIAVGVMHKQLHSSGLDGTLNALGAKRSGTDVYVSATKLLLDKGLLLNATLRATKANQNGLLGFGAKLGTPHDSYRLMPELSVAYLLNRQVAIGAEYRKKPNNLEDAGRAAGLGSGLREDNWKDVFIAWAPSKHLSLTLAYVDLGRVVPATTNGRRQTGSYLSAQVAF